MTDKITEIFRGEVRDRIEPCGMAAQLSQYAGDQGQQFAGDLAGFAVIVLDSTGKWSLSCAVDKSTAISKRMLMGIIIAAATNEMAETAARETLVDQGLVRPPENKT